MSHKDLEKKGWIKRNIIDEPRLSEIVETYETLGFEVLLKDYDPREFPNMCDNCMAVDPENFKVIYTRRINPEK